MTLQGSKVEFKPSISELTQTVNSVSKEAIATTGAMPRLSEALRDAADGEGRPTFYTQVKRAPGPSPTPAPAPSPSPTPTPSPSRSPSPTPSPNPYP